jgi:hypothetical protein
LAELTGSSTAHFPDGTRLNGDWRSEGKEVGGSAEHRLQEFPVMTDQKPNGNQSANDPLRVILQHFMQISMELLNALEQSERWPDIEPDLKAAMTAIEKGEIFSLFTVCEKLEREHKVSAEDQFNLHGLLSSRMAIERLARIREIFPEDPLRIGLLLYYATAAGAGFQRFQGSLPVKKALQEWEPYVERDKVRQTGCSTGGIESRKIRADEAQIRHAMVIDMAKKLFADGKSPAVVKGILAKRSFEGKTYTKRQIERILKKAGLV